MTNVWDLVIVLCTEINQDNIKMQQIESIYKNLSGLTKKWSNMKVIIDCTEFVILNPSYFACSSSLEQRKGLNCMFDFFFQKTCQKIIYTLIFIETFKLLTELIICYDTFIGTFVSVVSESSLEHKFMSRMFDGRFCFVHIKYIKMIEWIVMMIFYRCFFFDSVAKTLFVVFQ